MELHSAMWEKKTNSGVLAVGSARRAPDVAIDGCLAQCARRRPRRGQRESGRAGGTARLISHTHERSLTRPRTRHTRHTRQYTTQKSKKNTPERIEMKKYNKYLRRHTLHREIK